MTKCEVCGKDVDLPFQCSFCDKYFCIEHRLPENHKCSKAPSRTPLGDWKAKIAPILRIGKPLHTTRKNGKFHKRCPKCGLEHCPKCTSKRFQMTAHEEDGKHYLCLDCDFKWIVEQQKMHGKAKKSPVLKVEEIPRPSPTPYVQPKRRSRKVGKAISVLGIIVLLLGVGLMVFPQSSHKEGEFEFQSLGRPVSAFDLGVIPKNVEIRVEYDVKEDPYGLGLSQGRLYVILVNASELFEIDKAWNNRPAKDLLYPHYSVFKFSNVDFDWHVYDGPSEEGSLSWVTPYQTNYTVLVWLDEVGVITLSLVYYIRIDATWHPLFSYGVIVTIVGIITAGIGFAYRRYSSR